MEKREWKKRKVPGPRHHRAESEGTPESLQRRRAALNGARGGRTATWAPAEAAPDGDGAVSPREEPPPPTTASRAVSGPASIARSLEPERHQHTSQCFLKDDSRDSSC